MFNDIVDSGYVESAFQEDDFADAADEDEHSYQLMRGLGQPDLFVDWVIGISNFEIWTLQDDHLAEKSL